MKRFMAVVACLIVAGPVCAESLVTPAQAQDIEGNAWFFFGNGDGNGEAVRVQVLIPSGQFDAMSGFLAIRGFALRVDRTAQSNPGAFSSVIPSMQVTVSTTPLAIGEFSSDFDDNFTVNQKTVISGPFNYNSPGAGGFDIPFHFDQPINYNPATGHLVVDYQWSGVTDIAPFADSMSNAGPGFGVVSQVCDAGQCEGQPVQVLPGWGMPMQFNVDLENTAASLTAGSPTTLWRILDTPTPADPFELSLDYLFQTTTGELTVRLGSQVLAVITAAATPEVDFTTATLRVDDPSLLGQPDLELAFTLDGPAGSSVLLDNVFLPGLVNGAFDQALTGWVGEATGAGSVAPVAIASVVPEPGSAFIMLLAMAGLARRGAH